MTRIEVGEVGTIGPGERAIVEVGHSEIGVFNVDGEYYALPNQCPHQGGPLCEGPVSDTLTVDESHRRTWGLDGEVVYCPWHQLRYHIPTGESFGAFRDLPTYDVSIEDGRIVVEV